MALDSEIHEVAKDQGFAATVIDLCDQAGTGDNLAYEGDYELTGKDFKIFVTSITGKDNFAKSYLITLSQD